jgi:metal-dependent amidase/aminoacylase/carboxypeptidase family protein
VAYRADMDAVPPDQQIGGGNQPAHVCGHDIHTTVGVGIAEVLARLHHRLAGTFVFLFQPAEEALAGAAAMLADGVLDRFRPAEIHALHCGPFPVGHFAVMPGYGLPGQDKGVVTLTGPDAETRAQSLVAAISALGTVSPPATPADMERLVATVETPDGPLTSFVFMGARAAGAEVRISYRCWPEARYTEIREKIRVVSTSYGPAQMTFPPTPFPAMRVPEREGQAQATFLRQEVGAGRVSRLHAAVPFNGEDFALFLNQIPGTYTFLGVRSPGSPIQESYPHLGTFTPDERAIAVGVRTMAHWLTART